VSQNPNLSVCYPTPFNWQYSQILLPLSLSLSEAYTQTPIYHALLSHFPGLYQNHHNPFTFHVSQTHRHNLLQSPQIPKTFTFTFLYEESTAEVWELARAALLEATGHVLGGRGGPEGEAEEGRYAVLEPAELGLRPVCVPGRLERRVGQRVGPGSAAIGQF
jgi:hypothetical protein